MNAELLLQEFDRLSEAPDAVSRLREMVRDLAVRGNLLPQDPSDTPVTELLRAIEQARADAVTRPQERSIRESVPLRFPLPVGWSKVSMGWIASKLGAGSTPLGGKSRYQQQGIPFLRSQNVYHEGLRLGDVAYIDQATHQRMSGTHVHPDDLLLNITGASIGRCALVPDTLIEANVSQHVAIIRLHLREIRDFIHLALTSPYFQNLIREVEVGVSREGLSMRRLRLFVLPLPPLAEQQRIVAKVDELMTVCDELETAQEQRERRRKQLSVASLARLTAAGDTQGRVTEKDVTFFLSHPNRMVTRPNHVADVRRVIRRLAIQGRLSSPATEDETVDVLIADISRDRIARGLRNTAHRTVSAAPYEIPNTWRWMPLGSVLINRDGERIPVSREERSTRAKKFDYYGASGVIDRIDGYLFDKPLLLIGEDGANLINRSTPIAFIARGKYWVNNHAHVLDAPTEDLLRWAELFINATDLTPYITGTAQPKMNQAKMNGIPVAIPPLAEQRRIVAKVDELMATCDELERSLAAIEVGRARALEAALHEVIEEADASLPVLLEAAG